MPESAGLWAVVPTDDAAGHRSSPPPYQRGTSGAGAAGTKFEDVLAGLEGLSKEDLKKVGERMKELMGK